MAAQDQNHNLLNRAFAFEVAGVLEAGEPSEDNTNKYMVMVVAPDGDPIIISLGMATTMGVLNCRLDDAYGENLSLIHI